MNNIYKLIAEKQAGNYPLVLATVIETHGSTPQKHGSSALFCPEGLLEGTVGGGVLEGKVQHLSKKALKSKESGTYHFNLDNDISVKHDAICGGKATILIDASPEKHISVFARIEKSINSMIPGVLVTIFNPTEKATNKIDRFWLTRGKKSNLPDQYSDLINEEAEKLLSALNADAFVKLDLVSKGKVKSAFALLEPLFPPSQLIIAGAGHIGKAVAHLGKLLGFEVTVIDDRSEYANKANIPDADHLIVEDIGKAIRDLRKNSDAYVVIVTRGHYDDAKALKSCINSDAAYVGMIGSKNKIAQMRRNFVQKGWATEEQWSAIHAPIGLEIMSQTVEEIAVSIAAELVLERNKRNKALSIRH